MIELPPLNKGKSVPTAASPSTPFWKKITSFITGDVTNEEMTAILNRQNEIYDHRKTQEIPPNIKKASK